VPVTVLVTASVVAVVDLFGDVVGDALVVGAPSVDAVVEDVFVEDGFEDVLEDVVGGLAVMDDWPVRQPARAVVTATTVTSAAMHRVRRVRHAVGMTVIKINALTVPAEAGPEVARRFAARVGAVDGHDGFEGFELLAPTDGRAVWLVVTRWRDEAAFEAWRTSPSFAHGHRGGPDGAAPAPMPLQAELWSYEVAVASGG
jgi:heme-degrading monooxygenase HmoA